MGALYSRPENQTKKGRIGGLANTAAVGNVKRIQGVQKRA